MSKESIKETLTEKKKIIENVNNVLNNYTLLKFK